MQQSMLDTAATTLYRDIFALESALQDTGIAIQATDIRLRGFIDGFKPTYQRNIAELQNQNAATPQDQFYNKLEEVLREFDKSTRFDHWVDLYVPRRIKNLKKELAGTPTALGTQPNPMYLDLAARLADIRLLHGERPTSGRQNATDPTDFAMVRELYIELQAQRDRIEETLNIIVQKKLHDAQRISLEKNQRAIGNSLTNKAHNYKRLSRDRDLLLQTIDRLSELAEGARISRAKAANDIRVLTQALEVRSISQTPIQQKSAIAAGVGLLIAAILSLLIEYVRKARQKRTTANAA
jgi:hypothetical protein